MFEPSAYMMVVKNKIWSILFLFGHTWWRIQRESWGVPPSWLWTKAVSMCSSQRLIKQVVDMIVPAIWDQDNREFTSLWFEFRWVIQPPSLRIWFSIHLNYEGRETTINYTHLYWTYSNWSWVWVSIKFDFANNIFPILITCENHLRVESRFLFWILLILRFEEYVHHFISYLNLKSPTLQ